MFFPSIWSQPLATIALGVLAALLAIAGAANASLIGSTVTSSLLSPGDGVSAIDTTIIGSGIEIQAGDGSNIGGFMFTSTAPDNVTPVPELIDFFATGVTVRIAGADPSGSGTTGYAAGAEYVFSSLNFLGGSIFGIDSIVLSANISSFSSNPQPTGCTSGVCFDPIASSLTLFLDQMVIGADGNLPAPMGLVTVNLRTSPVTPPPNGVPEPATILLIAVGLLGIGFTRVRFNA